MSNALAIFETIKKKKAIAAHVSQLAVLWDMKTYSPVQKCHHTATTRYLHIRGYPED